MIDIDCCKKCGGERFEVVVQSHHDLLIDDDEGGKAHIDESHATVGPITCSTCSRLIVTPKELTEDETRYLLGDTTPKA